MKKSPVPGIAMMSKKKTHNQNIETLDLFPADALIRNEDESMAIILKSGEVDRGDGESIRQAVALAIQTKPELIPEDLAEGDFSRLQAGRSVSFSSMCRMLSALGLKIKIERDLRPKD